MENNRRRSRNELEYELLDTGIFDGDRYFDVFVEYAKAAPEDILIKITVANRGPEAASLHVLPTLWFRHTWSSEAGSAKPLLRQIEGAHGMNIVSASHSELGERFLYCKGAAALLFTENETNHQRLFGSENRTRYVKDGINDYVVHGRKDSVNPERNGTKAAAHYTITVPAGDQTEILLRLTDLAPQALKEEPFGSHFDAVLKARQSEADEFYQSITPASASGDAASVMRQALSGMLWSKQYYFFDVDKWLEEHGVDPFAATSGPVRNLEWVHMINDHVISMPDKWEYPGTRPGTSPFTPSRSRRWTWISPRSSSS